jgi:predicted peptidase
MRQSLACALGALVMAACVAHAAALARKLVPGSTVTVTFPDMPPTFHAVSQKKNVKAQMTVYLPTNYDPSKNFPLLIWLSGGDGGDGATLGVVRGITQGRDFVCVSTPLFKAGDPKTNYIMVDADGKYMWPLFKAMLAKLEEMVPNIDPAHRVLGGSSNGAHATAALVDGSDGEICKIFSAFLLVEGGGKMKHFEYLKGKRYMMVSSQSKSKPRALEICNAAKAAGAKTSFLCEDVGKHCFPESAYPAVRTWLRGPALE